jgi:hypothetical protein
MGGAGYKIFFKQTIAKRDASLQPTYTQVMPNVVTPGQTYTSLSSLCVNCRFLI